MNIPESAIRPFEPHGIPVLHVVDSLVKDIEEFIINKLNAYTDRGWAAKLNVAEMCGVLEAGAITAGAASARVVVYENTGYFARFQILNNPRWYFLVIYNSK